MAAFVTDLMNSIFVPGPTPSIIVATNASFAALQVLLFCLLVATFSIHFLVLSGLCAGLWWSINWFVSELRAENAKQAEKDKSKSGGGVGEPGQDGASDTDVETIVDAGIKPGGIESASKEVEVIEKVGELKVRASAGGRGSDFGGSGTEHSTEDEWEKVDENENEKDK